jgi:hypothetical protein
MSLVLSVESESTTTTSSATLITDSRQRAIFLSSLNVIITTDNGAIKAVLNEPKIIKLCFAHAGNIEG